MKQIVIIFYFLQVHLKLYCVEAGIFWENEVNTMAADALVPHVAEPSAAMSLTMWNGDELVFLEIESQQLSLDQCQEMLENAQIFLYFLK